MAEPSFDSSDEGEAKAKAKAAIYTESSDHDGDGGPPREGVLRQIWTSEKLAVSYLIAEARRSKRSFCIGLFTVFLVVAVVSLLQNAVLKSPIIFFRISEREVGENDLIITPGIGVNDKTTFESATLQLVNQTLMDTELTGESSVRGTVPRWILTGEVLSPNDLTAIPASAIVLGMNSLQEAQIGLGRVFAPPPLQPGECYLSRSIARQVGVRQGDTVTLQIDALKLAETVGALDSDDYQEEDDDGTELTIDELKQLGNLLFPDVIDDAFWAQPADLSFLDNITVSDVNTLNITLGDNATQAVNGTIDLDNFNQTAFNVTLNGTEFGFEGFLDELSDQLNAALPGGDAGIDLYELWVNSTDAQSNQLDAAALTDGVLDLIILNQQNQNATVEEVVTPFLPVIEQLLRFNAAFTVAAVVAKPEGKWPQSLGSVIAVEFEELFELLRESAQDILRADGDSISLGTIDLGGGTTLGPIEIQVPGLERVSVVGVLEALGVDNTDGSLDTAVADADQLLSEVVIRENALLSVVQYTDRLEAYVKSEGPMEEDIIGFTDQVARAIGVKYPATFTVPIAEALALTIFVRYFLDNIFGAVIALLVILGVLLIYSLLLNDVESKTYEYGMLRALGMRKNSLIQVLVTKSLMFSVPGILLGLFVSFLANIPVAQLIADFGAVDEDYGMFTQALVTAIILGIVMPLVANIAPISRALGRTLRDSLDVYHHVVSDVTVRVVKLADLGVDLWQTWLAILLIVVGFVTFYIIPYAFTFRNIPLFFAILNGVLLGMLLGLALIAQSVQAPLERLMLRLLLSCHNKHLRGIVQKNLSGHRGRNAKTAQMFTICLAFLVFAGTMFSLQASALGDNIRVALGSDIFIQALTEEDRLREPEMRAWLDDNIARRASGDPTAMVEDYAFVTFNMRRLAQVERIRFGTLPAFPTVNNRVYGVPANYLNVIYDDFFMLSSSADGDSYPQTRSGDDDVIRQMYDDAGNARLPEESNGIVVPRSLASGRDSNTLGVVLAGEETAPAPDPQAPLEEAYTDYLDVVVSEALREYSSVSLATPLELSVRSRSDSNPRGRKTLTYMCKARGMVKKVPGFFFSSYRAAAFSAPTLIRIDQFERVQLDAYEGSDLAPASAPKEKLHVRMVDGFTTEQLEDTIDSLRTYFRSDSTLAINVPGNVESAEEAVELLNLFFLVVGIIAMVMCFFILWLSFTANVRENAWEFGVLRAVGLSAWEVVLVYVYEALALVFAACLLGTCIGVLISVSLTLQFNLFTEMPFKLVFPTLLFCTMIGMAIVVAIVGSIVPARTFLKMSISEIIRRS